MHSVSPVSPPCTGVSVRVPRHFHAFFHVPSVLQNPLAMIVYPQPSIAVSSTERPTVALGAQTNFHLARGALPDLHRCSCHRTHRQTTTGVRELSRDLCLPALQTHVLFLVEECEQNYSYSSEQNCFHGLCLHCAMHSLSRLCLAIPHRHPPHPNSPLAAACAMPCSISTLVLAPDNTPAADRVSTGISVRTLRHCAQSYTGDTRWTLGSGCRTVP